MGFIKACSEFYPAGKHTGSGKSATKFLRGYGTTVTGRVSFKESMFFIRVWAIRPNGNLLFQEFSRFCPVFSFERGLFLVRPRCPVDGGRAGLEPSVL